MVSLHCSLKTHILAIAVFTFCNQRRRSEAQPTVNETILGTQMASITFDEVKTHGGSVKVVIKNHNHRVFTRSFFMNHVLDMNYEFLFLLKTAAYFCFKTWVHRRLLSSRATLDLPLLFSNCRCYCLIRAPQTFPNIWVNICCGSI